MAYRAVTTVEIQEIIRRWQAGEGNRQISSGTGASRNTARKYLSAARAEGIVRRASTSGDKWLKPKHHLRQAAGVHCRTRLLVHWSRSITCSFAFRARKVV